MHGYAYGYHGLRRDRKPPRLHKYRSCRNLARSQIHAAGFVNKRQLCSGSHTYTYDRLRGLWNSNAEYHTTGTHAYRLSRYREPAFCSIRKAPLRALSSTSAALPRPTCIIALARSRALLRRLAAACGALRGHRLAGLRVPALRSPVARVRHPRAERYQLL